MMCRHKPKVTEPTDHGSKLPKMWVKIIFSVHKEITSSICYSEENRFTDNNTFLQLENLVDAAWAKGREQLLVTQSKTDSKALLVLTLGSQEISKLNHSLFYSYCQGIMTSPDPPPSVGLFVAQLKYTLWVTFQLLYLSWWQIWKQNVKH